MPHIPEVRPTSHEHHDPMLVAALAAGDLAGTDRDQAITLTRTCADCADLHADLLALASATAAAPAPVATRPRDFRLTPADAARLHPSRWRRLAAAIAKSPTLLSRPMGVGLATLGLVGLLIGNVHITGFMGSSAATPAPQSAAGAASSVLPANPDMVMAPSDLIARNGTGSGPDAASSVAPAAAASQEIGGVSGAPAASIGTQAAPIAAADGKTASEVPGGLAGASRDAVAPEPTSPLNLLFGAAVVVGLAILAAAALRGRRTA